VRADNVRFNVSEAGVIQPQFGRLTAPQVVPYHVGGANQFLEQCPALGTFQVKRHAALGQVKGLEVGAVVLCQGDGSRLSRWVTAGGAVLHLDDIGSEFGQIHGPIGSGAELLDSDNPNALERFLHSDSQCVVWMGCTASVVETIGALCSVTVSANKCPVNWKIGLRMTSQT